MERSLLVKANERGGGKLVAIIDIDCKVEGGFDEMDEYCLELLSQMLASSCNWDN